MGRCHRSCGDAGGKAFFAGIPIGHHVHQPVRRNMTRPPLRLLALGGFGEVGRRYTVRFMKTLDGVKQKFVFGLGRVRRPDRSSILEEAPTGFVSKPAMDNGTPTQAPGSEIFGGDLVENLHKFGVGRTCDLRELRCQGFVSDSRAAGGNPSQFIRDGLPNWHLPLRRNWSALGTGQAELAANGARAPNARSRTMPADRASNLPRSSLPLTCSTGSRQQLYASARSYAARAWKKRTAAAGKKIRSI